MPSQPFIGFANDPSNPEFRGRDQTSDAINQDLATTLLVPGVNVPNTYPQQSDRVRVTGLAAGSNQANIFMGGNSGGGAPTTGDHEKGEIYNSSFGGVIISSYYCTVAGNPGTWVQMSGLPAGSPGGSSDLNGTYPNPTLLENVKKLGIQETFPRWAVTGGQTVLATGRISLAAIALPTGKLITNISFAGSGAMVTPTNWWFVLCDNTFKTLRSTADQLTAAWAADTRKTLALASTFTTTYAGLHYIGIMVKAATVPTLHGMTGNSTSLATSSPLLSGADGGARTVPLADGTTIAAVTGQFAIPWGNVT